ncbi:MAG TPA: ribosome maturation factor RimP [Candidatus Onthoplasma faecigallinarum]|nr:ribosome maturation factor RimP [Candidatus Onthoplasma faecigallinarum]
MKIADLVYDTIKPLFKNDIKLLEVEYVKKSDGMHLVVYIDKDTGVSIDDCVYVNDLISDTIDELNPTKDEKYVLDVSSYGLDRPLKYDWQFKKYQNQKVNVKLYKKLDGKKEFVATLLGKDDKQYYFNLNDENITINIVDVANITPYIEF